MNDDIMNDAPARPVYEGVVTSALISGKAKLTIDADCLLLESLFDSDAIPFADMDAIAFENYSVRVSYGGETATFSQMGVGCEWFFRELTEAFNAKVRASLRIEGAPVFETKGNYAHDAAAGAAAIKLYADCLCVFPADVNARRLPLRFMNGMSDENYALSISLSTGERCTLSMLGYDHAPLSSRLAECLRALRERDSAFIRALDGSLGAAQASRAARLLPEGVASPLAALMAGAPSLAAALEKKIKNSKLKGTFTPFAALCDGERLAIGIAELPQARFEAAKEALLAALNAKLGEGEEAVSELTPEQEDSVRWIIWAAAPSKRGDMAAVEFAIPDEDTATYLFSLKTPWSEFLPLLNRALEATGLKREIFSLPAEKLAAEAHANDRMALRRTPATQALRAMFAGRVIHRSADAWRRDMEKALNGE